MVRKYRRRKALGQRRAGCAAGILADRKNLVHFSRKMFAVILRAVYKVGISFHQ
jgi:hypothetical protein